MKTKNAVKKNTTKVVVDSYFVALNLYYTLTLETFNFYKYIFRHIDVFKKC